MEIFVLPELWSSGVGSKVLILAEQFARNAGRTQMTLEAEPLDSDLDDDCAKISLIQWYKKRGYREVDNRYDQLRKAL